MRTLVETRFLDFAVFLGMITGLGFLMAAYFTDGARILAVPGLVALLPSLIYGLR